MYVSVCMWVIETNTSLGIKPDRTVYLYKQKHYSFIAPHDIDHDMT